MTRKVDNTPVNESATKIVIRDPGLPDAAMREVLAELRSLGLPFRPNNARKAISFQSLYAFLLAVRKINGASSPARLDVFDEGVGGAKQVSLIYSARRAGGAVFLRVTDDNARSALNPKLGLLTHITASRTPGSRKIGSAIFATAKPVSSTAVQRVLRGLPAEVSDGGANEN
jgi:hypothetical protein